MAPFFETLPTTIFTTHILKRKTAFSEFLSKVNKTHSCQKPSSLTKIEFVDMKMSADKI
jgi:hypothetical protein